MKVVRGRRDDPTAEFDINVFGMGWLRGVMDAIGMLATDYPSPPIGDEPVDRLVEGGRLGIPIHKLRSNDNWLVHPEELATALAVYDATTTDEAVIATHPDVPGVAAFWPQWIAFLRRAANEGGFRVR